MDLKQRTIRGGFAKICAQAADFVIRVGSLMILGRLLDPKDFGLVGMVTALTGVFNLFRDFGLSTASIQRKEVSDEELSTLFWINMLIGGLLGLLSLVSAPVVVIFYHEPRLFAVTAVLAAGFVLNAMGVQHSALLQRRMRFIALSAIGVSSSLVSALVGIGLAKTGWGYWALVWMSIASLATTSICLWLTTGWIPGKPRRNQEIRSMMRFGGTVTLNGLVVYVAYNLDNVLLGRYWGAGALGIYGRAYQLLNIPTDNLNAATGSVAFPVLSRLQDQAASLRNYFLKAYSLVVALTLPITVACALFSGDMVSVLLGPKWTAAAPIFRGLAPAMLAFALMNPFSWLLFATGLVRRSLSIALVIAPLTIAGDVIGLGFGPVGVAIGHSAALSLWVIPHILWCIKGTPVSAWDILRTLRPPLLSIAVATPLAFVSQLSYHDLFTPLARLVLGCTILMGVYITILCFVMGQKSIYLDLLRKLTGRSTVSEETMVAA
jgi:O-antigen/teichoic acid export membrane protein